MNLARAVAIVVAVGAGIVGVWRGTWAVGGSDSSCYALMAKAFANGELQPTSPLALDAPWPERSATFAPGGFIPSPVRSDAASPVCAAGFSVFLAPMYLVGGADAIFLLTPLAGALLVYVTFLLGEQLAGAAVGVAAAIVVAASPVFVFQVVQPMNDILVALLWTTVLWLATSREDRSAWIGVATGLAILVRPNLAPAAVLVGLWLLSNGWRRFMHFVVAASPALVMLLALNAALYGSPLQSGYGRVADLFALGYVSTNLQNYGRSLVDTQLAFPLLGLAAPFLALPAQRRAFALGASVGVVIVAIYLLYRPLPEWWYLRFLLPALPVLTVMAMTAVVSTTGRLALVWPVALVVIGYALYSSAMNDAWRLTQLEHRFRAAGIAARERLTEKAIFLTVWESGSIRYHADRQAVVWDSLDARALDVAIQWLGARGHEVFIMIEDWEEPAFRERFSSQSEIGQLDWPPILDIERRVRVYRPADRARYLAGESIPTEYVWANRP